jgi:hypothetical protein
LKAWRLILVIVFTAMAFGACRQPRTTLPPLSENYRKADKEPFGSYVAYKEFRHLFSGRYVESVTIPFDEEWSNIKESTNDGKYSLYFLVAKNLVLDYSEVSAFMDYVKAGNDLFISADYIDTRLLESINCTMERMGEIVRETKGSMHQTNVRMYFGAGFTSPAYGYYYYPFLNAVSGYDSSFARVLGVNEINTPNYVILFEGRGRIYLHVAPRVFSNYFMLSGDNYHYLDNVISYLRSDPKNIYWDEYYKTTSISRRKSNNSSDADDDFSSMSVINQHPPLQWAFWLTLTGLLLYILFNMKRKQRIINIVKPNANTTLTFTETVGRLYLQKKNNAHIAEKMITYFYEYIRNKYFIGTASVNDEFIASLSGKSGFPKEKTEQLFSLIGKLQSKEEVEDDELLQLNSQIENFYKNQR